MLGQSMRKTRNMRVSFRIRRSMERESDPSKKALSLKVTLRMDRFRGMELSEQIKMIRSC